MAAISTTEVKIPRWLRRAERGESRLTTDLEKAYRRSDLALWARASYFFLGAVGRLVQTWMHAHHEKYGRLSEVLFIPVACVLLFSVVIGTEERWIAAVVLRARARGGVGLRWVTQQAPIRRWHWYTVPPMPVFFIAFIAIWPVTHQLDRHPNSTRREIEFCEQAALCLCYALLTAVVFRRVNRKCFRATRDALLAAEADLAQEPAADATTGGAG